MCGRMIKACWRLRGCGRPLRASKGVLEAPWEFVGYIRGLERDDLVRSYSCRGPPWQQL